MDFLNKIQKPWKFLAPMVANSELAYRSLARKYGADVCYTEMVHCKQFNNSKTNPSKNRWYTTNNKDRPLVIQICGNNPDEMLKTCLALQDHCNAIDINFGCPQEIAKKGHYGSFLMEDWDLISDIITTLSSNIKIPLFCKIRVFSSIQKTIDYARMIERSGCSLLVVHGRTRDQRGVNTGLASWEHIKAVKNILKIPVLANGNMIYHNNIKDCIDFTKCDGVMIAEPHLYDPTIFVSQTISSLDILKEYYLIIQENPESAGLGHIKSHSFKILKHFLSFYPQYREILNECSSIDEYLDFIDNLKDFSKLNKVDDVVLGLHPYIRK